MVRISDLRRLEADIGELLAHRERAADSRDFARYADDPVGFLREILGCEPWEKQIEISEAIFDKPLVTVRSCHASGKDWLGARLALWWCYARAGLALLTGPTAAQVEEILMRHEVRTAFAAADLPGDLHIRALRPSIGAGRILTRTGSGVSALTGFHDSEVLFIITEAQDPEIDHAWDAAFSCATGEGDRILTLGNPTEPLGRFHSAHQPGSGWHAIQIRADDVPNVREGRTLIPGLLTREGVARFRKEYGEASPVVVSRVDAEFPSEATDSLVRTEWLDRAEDLWREDELEYLAKDRLRILGVDPARLGPDRTAVCIRQGPIVRELLGWRGADTMDTAERVRALVSDLVAQGHPVETVWVDEIGLGGGVLDRLRELLPSVRYHFIENASSRARLRSGSVAAEGFIASARAGLPDRFSNRRAQAYWHLRTVLERGEIALPPNPDLREELLATRVRFGADGRTSIEPKEALQGRLGRSPDLADALVISLAPDLAEERRRRVMFA